MTGGAETGGAALAQVLARAAGGAVLPRSLVRAGAAWLALSQRGAERRLLVLAPRGERARVASGFRGEWRELELASGAHALLSAPLDEENARALGALVPALAPRPLGRRTSVGLGDRLGCATPGHLRALRGSGIAPVLAQQSIREMERSGRGPGRVLADAVFGALAEGWLEGFGADADHLKEPLHVERCLEAGFTLFTLDPSAHVLDAADSEPPARLREHFEALDWDALEAKPADLVSRYARGEHRLAPGLSLALSEEDLLRAAVKYGRALVHVAELSRHLQALAGDREVELEISVDETRSPTRPEEHFFVASELRRLGVEWISLAPRFSGAFEKGVEYRGDPAVFRRELARHAAIARALGDYKLSLHSGSDKFSLYPACAELAGDRFHLKTAGTSWLEALRCTAELEPELFREIWALARERYALDRASYAVSGEVAREPAPESLSREALPGLLERDGARQILHVCFGSVLRAPGRGGVPPLRERLLAALAAHEERHAELLERHFRRHLAPFAGRG